MDAFCEDERHRLGLEAEEAVGHLWVDVPMQENLPDSFSGQTAGGMESHAMPEGASRADSAAVNACGLGGGCSAGLSGSCVDAMESANRPAALQQGWNSDGFDANRPDTLNSSVVLNLYPVVWVRDTRTLCRETACGSGTLACAIDAQARMNGSRFSVVQPSGCALSVDFRSCGSMIEVGISGPVRMAARGEADVDGLLF